MREFFHGWRRKAGCITLVLACAIFMMWMRSLVIEDQIMIKPPDEWHRYVHLFESSHSVLSWTAWNTALGRFQWRSVAVGPNREVILSDEWPQYRKRLGMRRAIQYEVPYWALVLPLALLSAWSILRRAPRRNFDKTYLRCRGEPGNLGSASSQSFQQSSHPAHFLGTS